MSAHGRASDNRCCAVTERLAAVSGNVGLSTSRPGCESTGALPGSEDAAMDGFDGPPWSGLKEAT